MIIAGQKAVADMFGVTHKTIVEWQEQGMPVQSRGSFVGGEENRYDAAACIRWYTDREVGKVRTESPADRLNRAKADSVEMDNAERRGQLVVAADIEPRITSAIINAREMWRNEPSRLATALVGLNTDQIEDMLSESFEAFLHRMANWAADQYTHDDDDDVIESDQSMDPDE